jgi:PAT family beta-lactamase induction signal transducer AmpG
VAEDPETRGLGIWSPQRSWVVTTYFAEGFPYSLVRQISTVYFKDAGASLQTVGMTSLYGLPWILKLLWAPLLDAYSSKRRWLVAFEVLLAASTAGLALVSGLVSPLVAASVFFLITAFFSATHDIAVDGYYLESLDRTEQARFVGYQAMSYRLALVAGGGGVLWISGRTSWVVAFFVAAGLLLLLALFHGVALPPGEPPRRSFRELAARALRPRALGIIAAAALAVWALVKGWGQLSSWPSARPTLDAIGNVALPTWVAAFFTLALVALLAGFPALKRRMARSESFYGKAFVTYLDQPRLWVVLGFLLTYRTGESFLLAMVYPLLKEIGIDRGLYGVIYGTFGILASIAGGILGGHLISRFGLRRTALPLALAQNVPNLFYMLLAWMYAGIQGHPELGSANPYLVTVFVVVESFGSGLGTAVFMVFIQRTCRPAFKAGHFAMATGLANVSATFAGVLSGFLAHSMGFSLFFGFTFLATLPGTALIFFLPYLDGSCSKDRADEARK